ncbi:hypothetical protein AB0L25_27765 [Spirillospora sp. NPDC052242]
MRRLGEGLDLRDLVCLLLTLEADRLLRHGLRRDYLRREEDLPAVRGRLLADRQVMRRFGRLDRLECRYDERSGDILDNLGPPTAYILYASDRDVRPRTVRLHRYDATAAAQVTCVAVNVPETLGRLAAGTTPPVIGELRRTLLQA